MSTPLFAAFLDEWKEKLALDPHPMPDMTMPVPGYIAYGVMALGGLFLLISLWRLLRLRIFRFLFGVIAAVLIAYYPVAYGVHYWVYKHNEAIKKEQGYSKFEQLLVDNIRYVDWGILGAGIFLGTLVFYLSSGGGRKHYEEEEEEYSQPPPVPRFKGRAAPKSQKDPFDFS